MDYFVFSILDTAARAFAQPFYAPAEQVAIRSVRDMVNAPERDNQLSRHPEDFELHHIAMFKDDEGVIVPQVKPRLVARCKDLVKAVQ